MYRIQNYRSWVPVGDFISFAHQSSFYFADQLIFHPMHAYIFICQWWIQEFR